MIPFNFEYYKPSSIAGAVEAFQTARDLRKTAVYYSGGTEFITFARTHKLHADVVIDLKGIPECNALELDENDLMIGAGVSLNKISESGLFPLLGETLKRIADHTSRNKITLGGNINSRLMYREGILPLLLADAKVKIAGKDTPVALDQVFHQEITLEPNAFLAQITVDRTYLKLPFSTMKRTRFSKVGYPVATVAALMKDEEIRIAFSGVCDFPFRSPAIEALINDTSLSIEKRIEEAITHLPAPLVHDMHASAEYRRFVLKNLMTETLHALEATK
jgi:CO/xanthine dehydrogenase FAD-binding subunit